jgi:hypothetical protein
MSGVWDWAQPHIEAALNLIRLAESQRDFTASSKIFLFNYSPINLAIPISSSSVPGYWGSKINGKSNQSHRRCVREAESDDIR